jgi:hypothetical protein
MENNGYTIDPIGQELPRKGRILPGFCTILALREFVTVST